jgi:hypothetical protein
VSKTGVLASGFPITNSTTIGGTVASGLSAPEMPALDYGNNLWVANQNGGSGGSLMNISSGNNGNAPTVTTEPKANGATTNTINGPFGVTVDGGGKVWVANRNLSNGGAAASILEYDSVTNTPVSPSGNLTLTQNGTRMPAPLNLETDPSGVLWITSYDGNSLIELLGPGSPTYTPRSTASGKNTIGIRP